MIGQTFGNYRIDAKRGEGGMGMFFRATDLQLDRVVGLKTLRTELLDDPELLDRLRTEARSLARLVHQNIANVLHYLVQDQHHFIVMEFVDGRDLAEIIKTSGLPAIDQLPGIVAQICAAVGYANSKGVIHRDLKPSNIMLTADGTVKVTDFGIAKILGATSQTRTGVAAGSLHYMAPEQVSGQAVDQRTDVYQLGATLYELTTGRKPFVSANEYELMTMQLNTMPDPPSVANARVPSTLDGVILRAMAKKPNERFQSVEQLNAAFQTALSGREDDEKTRYSVTPVAARRSPVADDEDATIVGGRPVVEGDHRSPVRDRIGRHQLPDDAFNRGTGRRVGIAIAIVIAVAAVGAYVFWPRPVPEPTPRDTGPVTAPACTLLVSAAIPDDVPPGDLQLLTMELRHPASGRTLDTIQAISGVIRERRVIEPAASVDIMITGTDRDDRLVLTGEGGISAPDGIRQNVSIALRYIPPPVAPATNQNGQRDSTQSPVKPPAPQPNLVINITPFSQRQQIDRVWIDGASASLNEVFELRVEPGVHTIRLGIGADRLTDTITVPAQGKVEMEFFVGSGRGRINVAARFPEGGGYADIWLDGVKTSYGTPFELREVLEGPHQVEVRQDGYRARHGPRIVEVRANDRVRAEFEMTPE